jgi:hypothetical protein
MRFSVKGLTVSNELVLWFFVSLFVFDDGTDRDVKNLDSGSARTKN